MRKWFRSGYALPGRTPPLYQIDQSAIRQARGSETGVELMTLTALTACDARVFVEANGVTCGLEALVMREGTCRVLRMSFLKILKSYAPRTNITIDAEGSGLQLASTRLAISNYSPSAFSPGKFQTFPVTDDWLVLMQRSTLRSRMFPALRQTSQAQAHVRARLG